MKITAKQLRRIIREEYQRAHRLLEKDDEGAMGTAGKALRGVSKWNGLHVKLQGRKWASDSKVDEVIDLLHALNRVWAILGMKAKGIEYGDVDKPSGQELAAMTGILQKYVRFESMKARGALEPGQGGGEGPKVASAKQSLESFLTAHEADKRTFKPFGRAMKELDAAIRSAAIAVLKKWRRE